MISDCRGLQRHRSASSDRIGTVVLAICLLLVVQHSATAQEPATPTPSVHQSGIFAEPIPAGEEELDAYWYRVDTRSPRATLHSLRRVMRGYLVVTEGTGYNWDNLGMIANVERQMPRLLDLQEVPSDFQRFLGMEAAVMLREVLARVPMPRLQDVPGGDEMAEQIAAGKPPIYRIPGTTIEIGLTTEGPHTGRYQFRRESVEQARLLYMQVREDPYVAGQKHIDGLYKQYFLMPGPLIPDAWIHALPAWAAVEIFEQTVWQWLIMLISTALYLISLRRLYLWIEKIGERRSEMFHRLLLLANPAIGILFTLFMEHFWRDQLFLSGLVLQATLFFTRLVYLFYSVDAVLTIGKIIGEAAAISDRFKRSQLDQQLVQLVVRAASVAVAVVVIIEGMQRIGFSLATLVAGAGVSGLAVALAAQNTFKNIIGGIEITLDRAFGVDDLVEVSGYRGRIEEIGLRSTRIRTLMGHQITIPNEVLANSDVDNIARRPNIRRVFDVTVTYDTPPEKITEAVEILRDILSTNAPWREGESLDFEEAGNDTHPNETINCDAEKLPKVYFNQLNSDSLNIYVSYWFHPPVWWDFMKHSHWINRQIMERFNAAGIDFAFPTQTLHLAGDDKRQLDIGLRDNSSRNAT